MGFNQGLAKATITRVSVAWHIKRLLDVMLAVAGLIFFAPLIVLVGIAIKLESGGPIFCREILYGYANQAIRALKFRAATSFAEGTRTRPRITRVGRVLRHTGIDEIPQLINVLLGDMSIVGPRGYVHRQELLGGHFRPLLKGFKPGLTGSVQLVEARHGRMTTEQRIAEDLRYAKQWSLLLDFKIIVMTLFVPKTGRAAA